MTADIEPNCDGDPAVLYTAREVAIAHFWQCDGIRIGVPLGEDIGRRKAAASWKALADHVHRFADLDPWDVAQEKRRHRQVEAAACAPRCESVADGGHGMSETPIPLYQIDPMPSFPVYALPEPVRAMVKAVAEFTQTDAAMAGTVALGVVSACAAGRVKVEIRGSWTEPTTLYAAVSSAPGTRKSPVFSAMTAPLVAAEKTLVDKWKEVEVETRTEKRIADQAARRAEASAASLDTPAAKAAAVSAAIAAENIEIPRQPRIMADDVTPEALAGLLAAHGGRIAVMSAEGGIFDTLAGRYSSGVPNLDTMLKGWSAEPVRVDRRGAPSEYIQEANITLMLTIQPTVLTSIARNAAFRGRGLLARVLFALPPNNVGRRKVGLAPIDDSVIDAYAATIQALAVDLDGKASDPARLILSAEAAQLLLDFEAELEPKLGRLGELGVIADWGSKAVGQTIRIAGLLHLVLGKASPSTSIEAVVGKPIDADTMRNAVTLIDYYTAHAKAAFIAMGTDQATSDAVHVLDHIRRDGLIKFTVRNLHTKLGTNRFPKVDDLRLALDLLEDHHWITLQEQPERTGRGRPPSPSYIVTEITDCTETSEDGRSRIYVDSVNSVTRDGNR